MTVKNFRFTIALVTLTIPRGGLSRKAVDVNSAYPDGSGLELLRNGLEKG